MDKLLGNISYVAWTGIALGLLFLIFVAIGALGYGFRRAGLLGSAAAVAARALGHHVDRPPLLFQLHADPQRAEDSRRAPRPRDRQGDRAGGAVLVSLGRDADAGDRPAARLECAATSAAGADA